VSDEVWEVKAVGGEGGKWEKGGERELLVK